MEGVPKPRIYSAEEIGAPIKTEKIPTPELFKASLSFDFVFGLKDGKKHPFCIEINGDDSGIAGAQKINNLDSTTKTVAGVRDTRNIHGLTKNRKMVSLARDIESGEFPISEENKKPILRFFKKYYMDDIKMFPHAHMNDDWIRDISNDKRKQVEYIPAENSPRELTQYDTNIRSSTGYWVIKHKNGRGGTKVRILDDSKIDDFIEKNPDVWERCVIQEYIPSLDADEAGEEMAGHASSLRLLLDFRCLESDEIEILYGFAYQRVSRHEKPLLFNNQESEKTAIVNLSSGALAYKASEEETKMAMEVAEQIIKNLASAYQQISGSDNNY